MCGPVLAWDWFTLDLAYGMALLGGTIVLRARKATPATWVAFGILASCAGAILSFGTYTVQAAASAPQTAAAILQSGC